MPKPCVHAQALALLTDKNEGDFDLADAPPEWAQGLPVSNRPITTRATPPQPLTENAARVARSQSGFGDLETWLLDTLSRGVATVISEDPNIFKSIAVRLADASLRGMSRSFRLLDNLPTDSPDWPERVTAVLAEASLTLGAFRRKGQLPENLQRDLESVAGIFPKKEGVLAEGERLRDAWAVLSAVEETVEDQLRQRRTWLLGAGSGRYALLLEYAHGGGTDFLPGFAPGTVVEGTLVFYPSAWQQRALVFGEMTSLPQQVENLACFEKIEDMAREYAVALGNQPWISTFPAALRVVPTLHKDTFLLADSTGKCVPFGNEAAACWSVLALGGGEPLTVFGEWDGKAFTALSALDNERFVIF
ncbi:MAG: hypothetical protein ACKVU2_14975 [Saprospiraceae bacterium]